MRTVIVYPAYFFENYSRNMGRRVPKHLAFNADLNRIESALKAMNIKYEVVQKRYSKDPFKFENRIEVSTELPKTKLLQEIARKVREPQIKA
jgi:signal recognition particle subunit SEC65